MLWLRTSTKPETQNLIFSYNNTIPNTQQETPPLNRILKEDNKYGFWHIYKEKREVVESV